MIDVTCAIIRNGSRILAARRAEGRHLAGRWEFPGGKIDRDESPADCIVREIREELGIEVRPLRAGLESVHHYDGKSVRLIPLECELVSGTPRAIEHAEIGWFELAQLSDLDWCEADVPIVERIVRASPRARYT